MADNELGIIIKLRMVRQFMADTRAAKREVSDLGNQTEKAGRQAKDASRSSDAYSKSVRSTKTALKSLAAGYFGAQGLISAIRFVSNATAESRDVMRQTEAVMRSTGGAAKISASGVADLAQSISSKTGIDDEAIQKGENLLLTFTKIRNEAGKGNDIFNQSTQAITDMSVALKQDMKSSAIQLGKALNDPVKGVTALQRVGVSFTKQQKAQIKSMAESGNMLGAQKMILKELNTEFGGSAAAQATEGRKLAVQWENLAEIVGTKLEPLIQKLAGWGVKTISWLTGGSKSARILITTLKILLPAIAAFFIIQKIIALYRAWVGVQIAVNTAMSANPIGMVIAAVAALAAGIVIAWTHSQTFRTIVTGAFSAVKTAAGAVRDAIGWVVDKIQAAIDKVTGLYDKAKAVVDFLNPWSDSGSGGGAIKDILSTQQATQSLQGYRSGTLHIGQDKIPGRALGGTVYRTGAYLVGERGPEVAYLPRNTYVQARADRGVAGERTKVTNVHNIYLNGRQIATAVAEDINTQTARR